MDSIGRRYRLLNICLILLLPMVLRAGPRLELEERRISEQSRKPSYEIDLRYPLLRCCPENPEAAQTFNLAVTSVVQKRLAYYRAKQLPPQDSPHGGRLALRWTATTRRDGVISVLLEWHCAIAGNFHSNQELASLVFDTLSAKPIELSSLFQPDVNFISVLSRTAIADLIRQKERHHIDAEDRKWIERGAGPVLKNFKVFTLTDDALVLHFVTYQVGSYVEHEHEVRIPWKKLDSQLAIRWREALH